MTRRRPCRAACHLACIESPRVRSTEKCQLPWHDSIRAATLRSNVPASDLEAVSPRSRGRWSTTRACALALSRSDHIACYVFLGLQKVVHSSEGHQLALQIGDLLLRCVNVSGCSTFVGATSIAGCYKAHITI